MTSITGKFRAFAERSYIRTSGRYFIVFLVILASIAFVPSIAAFALPSNCPCGMRVYFETNDGVNFIPPSRIVSGFTIIPETPDYQNAPWDIRLWVRGQTGRWWYWSFRWDPNYWYIDSQYGHSHDNFSACERRGRRTYCIFTNQFRDRDWPQWGRITGDFAHDPASGFTAWVFCIGQSIRNSSISSEAPSLKEGLVNSFLATELQVGKSVIEAHDEQVTSVRFQFFDTQGRVLVDRETKEIALTSRLETMSERLPNGVYFYVVTVKGSNGVVYRSQVKKLIVLR